MAKEDFDGVDFGDHTPSEKVFEFKGVGELAKSYDALRTDNSSKIRIPGEDASEDDRSAFTATLKDHLGLKPPETAEEYSWKPPEGMEDQFSGYQDQLKKYHEAGYNDETVSFMMNDQVDSANAIASAMSEKQAELSKASETALKEKWGDDYTENMKAVSSMQERFPGLYASLSTAGLANQQDVLEAMHDVSLSVREDRAPGNNAVVQKGLADELKTLKASPAYMRSNDPKHSEVMQRVREIQRSLAG